jgi:hypothetical protein
LYSSDRILVERGNLPDWEIQGINTAMFTKKKVSPFRKRILLWGWGLIASVILLLLASGLLVLVTGEGWLAGRVLKMPPPSVGTGIKTTVTLLTALEPTAEDTTASTLLLDKITFGPREPIHVHFEVPSSFSDSGWVGLMPAEVPHGIWDSGYDYVSFEYLNGRRTGIIEFIAPDALGSYDIRIYDDMDQETATVAFSVISDEGKEATLQLNKKFFEQNEQILAYFEVPSSFSASAWLCMLSTKTPHGVWQDSYGCISYDNLKRRTAGVIDFTAPSTLGSYDLRIYDSTYGQEAVSVTFMVVLGEEKEPSIWLDKTSFNPGEQIEVHFTAPASFLSTAWVGIVPSEMSANEYKHDFPWKPLNKMTAGVLTFAAPVTPGSYDVRMNDAGGNNGQDVASITFTVENN